MCKKLQVVNIDKEGMTGWVEDPRAVITPAATLHRCLWEREDTRDLCVLFHQQMVSILVWSLTQHCHWSKWWFGIVGQQLNTLIISPLQISSVRIRKLVKFCKILSIASYLKTQKFKISSCSSGIAFWVTQVGWQFLSTLILGGNICQKLPRKSFRVPFLRQGSFFKSNERNISEATELC